MNILGMGPTEILLIVVLALIVFGPARLPEIMGQVGRAIADFRRATSALSDEFNRTIQTELNETRQVVEDTRAVLNDARSTVTQTHAAVTSAVAVSSPTAAPQLVAAPPASPTPVANGTSETHANGTLTSAVPPMADTTQWNWESSASSTSAEAAAPATSGASQASQGSAQSTSEPAQGSPQSAAELSESSEASESSEKPAHRPARQQPQLRDELLPPY
jgi:sec-independent protein translocase protein TatB